MILGKGTRTRERGQRLKLSRKLTVYFILMRGSTRNGRLICSTNWPRVLLNARRILGFLWSFIEILGFIVFFLNHRMCSIKMINIGF